MTIAKPVDDPWQASLDLEAGECCATVGIAVGLVARIISEPDGSAAPDADRLTTAWAAGAS